MNLDNFKEYYFLYRNKINMILISFVIIIIFIGGIILINYYNKNTSKETLIVNEPIIKHTVEEKVIENESIYVDIKGSVINEGVYELEKGSRVIDLISLAGGLKEDANTRYINLSKKLNDSEVIVIYSNGEIEEAKKSNIIYIETPCECESVNDACLENNLNSNDTLLININVATKEELMTLPGIGESKANSIIEYRNSKHFSSIEEIMNVTGISDTLYEKIKELITV